MHARLVVPSLALTLALTGCATTVALQPADDANNPGCAEVMVRLPDQIAGAARRTTNAQSTAAWGDPATVILRCGIAEPEASSLPCFSVNGIDWLRDDSQAPSYRFITFGRTPATEVLIDSTTSSGTDAIDSLGTAVGSISATSKCLTADDVFGN